MATESSFNPYLHSVECFACTYSVHLHSNLLEEDFIVITVSQVGKLTELLPKADYFTMVTGRARFSAN